MTHEAHHHAHTDCDHPHHHDHDCGCGHEHHDHHCDHSHAHTHNCHEKPVEITQKTHDGAAVVTAQCTLAGTGDTLDEAVRGTLSALAAWTNEHGGIIGHIKAALTKETMTVFSITDTAVHTAPQDLVTGHLHLAAIAYLVDPAELAQEMQTLTSALPLVDHITSEEVR